MKTARYPTTEVLWLDSAQMDRGDWMTMDDVKEHADDLMQRSIGYVVYESETALVLARSISEWEAVEKVEGVLCIPQVSIVDRR